MEELGKVRPEGRTIVKACDMDDLGLEEEREVKLVFTEAVDDTTVRDKGTVGVAGEADADT